MDRIEQFILSGMSRRSFPRSFFGSADDVYAHCLSIDLKENIIEVPSVLASYAIQAKMQGYDSMCKYLKTPFNIVKRKTLKGILSDFIVQAAREGHIMGIKTGADNIYYGMPGVIFDEEYNTLISINEKIELVNGTFCTTRCICRISPKVFQNADRIIEKNIIKKVIPMCTELIPANYIYGRINDEGLHKHIVVIVEDFKLTKAPSLFIDCDFTNTIKNHIKDICL